MLEYVTKQKNHENEKGAPGPGFALLPEFERLAKQRCAYCSGWGHSGNDCPTDAKITHMRGGVREQNTFIQKCRKEARLNANMKNVTGFSLLSANTMNVGRKRKRPNFFSDVQSMNDSLYAKRRRFV